MVAFFHIFLGSEILNFGFNGLAGNARDNDEIWVLVWEAGNVGNGNKSCTILFKILFWAKRALGIPHIGFLLLYMNELVLRIEIHRLSHLDNRGNEYSGHEHH